jgi:hypothetical protein
MNAATPGAAESFMRMAFDIDIRDVVPAIRVPTLVIHRVGDKVCHVENARFLARHIPAAHYVELPGSDHAPWAGGDDIIAEIREFVTGVREPAEPDRVLATVLFTDIVGSTEQAGQLGDRRWRDLVSEHHGLIRRELARFCGREIDTAGDGLLAAFDGPARALRAAGSIVRAVQPLGIQVRAGVHTGRVRGPGRQARRRRRARRRPGSGRGRAIRGARHRHRQRPGRRLGYHLRRPRHAAAERLPDQWRLYSVANT